MSFLSTERLLQAVQPGRGLRRTSQDRELSVRPLHHFHQVQGSFTGSTHTHTLTGVEQLIVAHSLTCSRFLATVGGITTLFSDVFLLPNNIKSTGDGDRDRRYSYLRHFRRFVRYFWLGCFSSQLGATVGGGGTSLAVSAAFVVLTVFYYSHITAV